MRKSVCLMTLLAVVWVLLGLTALAEEPAVDEPSQDVVVNTVVQPGETRLYKAVAEVKGKMPDPMTGQPTNLDLQFAFKLKHQYIAGAGEALLPLEISLTEGFVTSDGQKLEVTPSLYPKLTVLIDRSWRIQDIYGLSGARISQSLPGVNYANMIVLFFLPGSGQPRKLGDRWEATVRIPNYGESYSIGTTLKSLEMVDGINCAIVQQDIIRSKLDQSAGTGPVMKASAQSAFSVNGGRLIKSHVECDVAFDASGAAAGSSAEKPSPRQDQAPLRANIKVDISPGK